jgi:hypothetical protein
MRAAVQSDRTGSTRQRKAKSPAILSRMKPKTTYLVLCVFGAVLPYWMFVPWLAQNGLNPALFWQHLFANRISGFFAMDVLVSAVVLIGFVQREGSRLGMRRLWLPVAATLLVGVSLGFPLFLYMRQQAMEAAGGVS